MKKSIDTIGDRTRDLPTCSAVPQPTAPLRARMGAPYIYDINRLRVKCEKSAQLKFYYALYLVLLVALEVSTYSCVVTQPEDETLLVPQLGTGLRKCPSPRRICAEACKVTEEIVLSFHVYRHVTVHLSKYVTFM